MNGWVNIKYGIDMKMKNCMLDWFGIMKILIVVTTLCNWLVFTLLHMPKKNLLHKSGKKKWSKDENGILFFLRSSTWTSLGRSVTMSILNAYSCSFKMNLNKHCSHKKNTKRLFRSTPLLVDYPYKLILLSISYDQVLGFKHMFLHANVIAGTTIPTWQKEIHIIVGSLN